MPEAAFDLDLRVLRYIVCVADNGGFGRAAAALHVSQPSLSRQVRALERHLGVDLFAREPRGARLTPAGEAFLPRARGLLRAAADAIDSVAGAAGALTVAVAPGLDVTGAVGVLRAAHPESAIRTRYLGWRRPGDALLAGEFDVVVARLPFPPTGLAVDVLGTEPRVVAMHRGHRLAEHAYVTPTDLATEPLPDLRRVPDEVRDFWTLTDRRGPQAPVGPAMDSLDDTWQMVTQGDVLAVVTASQARAAGPGTVLVPLRDAAPATVVVATRAGAPSGLTAACRAALLDQWRAADRRGSG